MSEGEWQLCDRTGWPDNSSYLHLVAWCWRPGESQYLVVVNLSEDQSQASIHLPWDNLAGRTWHLRDVLNDTVFERNGDEMHVDGPVCGSARLEISLPVLAIRQGERGMNMVYPT